MIKTRLYLKFKIQLEKLNNGNCLPIPFEEKRSIVKCTTIIDKHSFSTFLSTLALYCAFFVLFSRIVDMFTSNIIRY